MLGSKDIESFEEYSIDIPLNKTQIKRKLILQVLYYLDVTNDKNHTLIGTAIENNSDDLTDKEINSSTNIGIKIYEDKEILDHVIQSFAEEYPINQLSVIDKSLLRLAFWEIKNNNFKGSNKQLVEDFEKLGYLFGSDNSNKFVKGVIKSLIKKIKKIELENKRKKGKNGDN